MIKGNRWHFPSKSTVLELLGEAHCRHYQQLQFSYCGTISLLLSLTLVVKPSAPTLTFYRGAGRTDALLTHLVPAASVGKDACMCWHCQINQMLLCEVVMCYLILGSLVKQIKVFPPSKVNPGAVQEMFLPEDKSFPIQDHARFGFFRPTQSSTPSQRAMYLETHHMV